VIACRSGDLFIAKRWLTAYCSANDLSQALMDGYLVSNMSGSFNVKPETLVLVVSTVFSIDAFGNVYWRTCIVVGKRVAWIDASLLEGVYACRA